MALQYGEPSTVIRPAQHSSALLTESCASPHLGAPHAQAAAEAGHAGCLPEASGRIQASQAAAAEDEAHVHRRWDAA